MEGFPVIQNYCIQAIFCLFFFQLCQLFSFISLTVSFEKEWQSIIEHEKQANTNLQSYV